MGCCGSKPETKYAVNTASTANNGAKPATVPSNSKPSGPRLPDFGLGELYENLMPLGKGGTGETYLMRERSSDRLVAVKVIPRPIPGPIIEMLKREIEIQGLLGEGHLNIINAYEVILSDTHLALVMEYAPGGSLTTYVSKRYETNEDTLGRAKGLYLSEDEALYFFRQFIHAVEYCHRHNVMHRDLKLDNTLLDGSDPPYIKICDFGFAKAWEDGGEANTRTIIGTPVYMSPEVLSSGVSHKAYDGKSADMWSSGVMLFVMLMGAFPYDHIQNPDPDSQAAHREVLLQQITNSWSDCIGSPLIKHLIKLLTPSCRDLLDRLFVTDSKKRLTIEELKAHPWFARKLPERYERSLNRMFQQQAQLDEAMNTGGPEPEKKKARSVAVRKMIDEAGRRAPAAGAPMPEETDELVRVVGRLKRVELRSGIDKFTKDRNYSDYLAAKRLGGHEKGGFHNYERFL